MGTNIFSRKDFSIILGVENRALADPVIKSLHPLQTHILIGNNYPSFSKLVNDAIVLCPTEIMIFCSHRVRPTPQNIQLLLDRIDAGYGLATLYRLGCFGFNKELIRKIGFFDERYLGGGYEDNDFYIRLQEANISYYEDESIEYHPGESTWVHPEKTPSKYKSTIFYKEKWNIDSYEFIKRKLPDVHYYDIGPSNPDITFKPWKDSKILQFSKWQLGKIVVDDTSCIKSKKIMIFGGTGSLGHKLCEMYGHNDITIYSRDENKHWQMSLNFKNLKFIIGDIRDSKKVTEAIKNVKPHIIIIASALKHIDRCEYESREAYLTNCFGVENIMNVIKDNYEGVERVVFISTDKACSPINTYGISKALAEKVVIETAYKMKDICDTQFTVVRYGNVLNSRGSILPILKKIGQSDTLHEYTLTHELMTRFIMTQEHSVQLIHYAITKASSGDIVIPKLLAMKIKDMIELFSEKYNKPYNIGKLRPGEKLAEALLNENECMRVEDAVIYYIVKPEYVTSKKLVKLPFTIYDSNIRVLSKEYLKIYLENYNFI